jgi:hypothetical protein
VAPKWKVGTDSVFSAGEEQREEMFLQRGHRRVRHLSNLWGAVSGVVGWLSTHLDVNGLSRGIDGILDRHIQWHSKSLKQLMLSAFLSVFLFMLNTWSNSWGFELTERVAKRVVESRLSQTFTAPLYWTAQVEWTERSLRKY